MVMLTLLNNGAIFEGHCPDQKACKTLTIFFNIFTDLFPEKLNVISETSKNLYQIISLDKKLIKNIHKYLKLLSTVWSRNEMIIIDKSY
ncbi:MAG: hypothetical protein LBF97_00860 [Elusimicrobiota bacterium]|jgi:hypothetical protein|nr:hypothetical protein [Elusimicrobiota bacterium]